MRRNGSVFSLLLVALMGAFIAPSDLEGQRPGIRERPLHRGFWIGFGLGGGWDDFDWDFGTRGRSASGYVRAGGTVSQHVLVGGEVLGLWRDEIDGDFTRSSATLTALLYPGPRGGWFLKTGFGFAERDFAGFDDEGISAVLGTGFDFRMGRTSNFYITPNVDLLVQFFDDETSPALLFTVGVGWH